MSTGALASRGRQPAREEAFAEYREHELKWSKPPGVDLLVEAQVELERALDKSVKAEVAVIASLANTERGRRGLLRLVAA
jgi:hypothetical protein